MCWIWKSIASSLSHFVSSTAENEWKKKKIIFRRVYATWSIFFILLKWAWTNFPLLFILLYVFSFVIAITYHDDEEEEDCEKKSLNAHSLAQWWRIKNDIYLSLIKKRFGESKNMRQIRASCVSFFLRESPLKKCVCAVLLLIATCVCDSFESFSNIFLYISAFLHFSSLPLNTTIERVCCCFLSRKISQVHSHFGLMEVEKKLK